MVIEVEYESGIERLDDPTPVRITVEDAGVRISEVMPGTRAVWIAASQIIEARLTTSLIAVGRESGSRWPLIGSLFKRRNNPAPACRNYTLTITYREDDRARTAVFHREESATHSQMSRVARMISALAKASANRKPNP